MEGDRGGNRRGNARLDGGTGRSASPRQEGNRRDRQSYRARNSSSAHVAVPAGKCPVSFLHRRV
jgi:hypothetical protein